MSVLIITSYIFSQLVRRCERHHHYERYLRLVAFFSFNFSCHSFFEGVEGRLESLLPVKISAFIRLSVLPISDPGYQVKKRPVSQLTVKSQLTVRPHPNNGKSCDNCWFSHDVTKFQTSELLILLRFYFHDV